LGTQEANTVSHRVPGKQSFPDKCVPKLEFGNEDKREVKKVTGHGGFV